MTRARKLQISLDATPYYHVYSRCVRKAFLCGTDALTGRSYEHQRQEIQDDMLRLSSIFFIEIAAFAVMSNHYHLVLFVDKEACMAAPGREIAKRWHQLYSGHEVSQKYIDGDALEPYEREQIDTLIDLWRSRLHNISWFIKNLNQNTACRANKEDDCTGHFWQARFKSQALLDEQAVLSCMAYSDLNPIRADMANTPETSDHTSIQMRIDHWQRNSHTTDKPAPSTLNYHEEDNLQPVSLLPFVGNHRQPMPKGIAFNLIDYLELVDWTGRAILDNKRGAIPADAFDGSEEFSDLHMLSHIDLSERARGGIFIYLVVWLITAFWGDIPYSHPTLFYLNTFLFVLIAGLRFTHYLLLRHRPSSNTRMMYQLLITLIFISACHWGITTVWAMFGSENVILYYPYMIITTAFAMAGTAVLSISRSICRFYAIVIFTPIILIGTYIGGSENLKLKCTGRSTQLLVTAVKNLLCYYPIRTSKLPKQLRQTSSIASAKSN